MSLGCFDLLGTTVLPENALPKDLFMDEKITFWDKEEVYACMTVGGNDILGMSLSDTENATGLAVDHGKFKAIEKCLIVDYQTTSINTGLGSN